MNSLKKNKFKVLSVDLKECLQNIKKKYLINMKGGLKDGI